MIDERKRRTLPTVVDNPKPVIVTLGLLVLDDECRPALIVDYQALADYAPCDRQHMFRAVDDYQLLKLGSRDSR